VILTVSCDPGYSIFIENKSQKDIYIETEKNIEDYLALKKGSFYDSIISKKIKSLNNKGLYKLSSQDKIKLFGYIGKPTASAFPYKIVKVINQKDTITISKNNLLSILTKGKNNYYYIIIK